MYVVPDRGLLDFIESLDEKYVEDTSKVLSEEEETAADGWQDIATALESWTTNIRYRKSSCYIEIFSTNNQRIVKETTTK